MQAPRNGSVPRSHETTVASALVAMTALALVTGCASNKTNTGTHSARPPASIPSLPGSNLARAEVAKMGEAIREGSLKTAMPFLVIRMH